MSNAWYATAKDQSNGKSLWLELITAQQQKFQVSELLNHQTDLLNPLRCQMVYDNYSSLLLFLQRKIPQIFANMIPLCIQLPKQTDSQDRKYRYPYQSIDFLENLCQHSKILKINDDAWGIYTRNLMRYFQKQQSQFQQSTLIHGYFQRLFRILIEKSSNNLLKHLHTTIINRFINHIHHQAILQCLGRIINCKEDNYNQVQYQLLKIITNKIQTISAKKDHNQLILFQNLIQLISNILLDSTNTEKYQKILINDDLIIIYMQLAKHEEHSIAIAAINLLTQIIYITFGSISKKLQTIINYYTQQSTINIRIIYILELFIKLLRVRYISQQCKKTICSIITKCKVLEWFSSLCLKDHNNDILLNKCVQFVDAIINNLNYNSCNQCEEQLSMIVEMLDKMQPLLQRILTMKSFKQKGFGHLTKIVKMLHLFGKMNESTASQNWLLGTNGSMQFTKTENKKNKNPIAIQIASKIEIWIRFYQKNLETHQWNMKNQLGKFQFSMNEIQSIQYKIDETHVIKNPLSVTDFNKQKNEAINQSFKDSMEILQCILPIQQEQSQFINSSCYSLNKNEVKDTEQTNKIFEQQKNQKVNQIPKRDTFDKFMKTKLNQIEVEVTQKELSRKKRKSRTPSKDMKATQKNNKWGSINKTQQYNEKNKKQYRKQQINNHEESPKKNIQKLQTNNNNNNNTHKKSIIKLPFLRILKVGKNIPKNCKQRCIDNINDEILINYLNRVKYIK